MPKETNIFSIVDQMISNALMGVWTACPAIVVSVDSETKRVSAQPLPSAKTEEGFVDMPVVHNVPLIFTSGGGYTVSANVSEGDSILLVFCRRGISKFKRDFKNALPSGGMMDMDSAVGIPCFGNLNITASEGISLQKDDGSIKVEVLDDEVKMVNGEHEMVLDSTGVVTALDFKTTTGVSLLGHGHSAFNTPPTPTP